MSERDDRRKSPFRAERMLGFGKTPTPADQAKAHEDFWSFFQAGHSLKEAARMASLPDDPEGEALLDLEIIRYKAEAELGNMADYVSGGEASNVIAVDFSRNANRKDCE